MKFSFIIPTLNRTQPLEDLLCSFTKYIHSFNYEIIIVDQNERNIIDNIIDKYKNELNINHQRVNFRGASKARNYGASLATGDLLNFPDDDSEISERLLNIVNEIFYANPRIDALFGRTVCKLTGENSVLNFQEMKAIVSSRNMFQTTVECTMFLRREIFCEIKGYDETLGVGTYYGADEGADLVLRLLYKHYNLEYNPDVIFYHPSVSSNYDENTLRRALTYGRGTGRLCHKHLKTYKNYHIFFRYIMSIIKHSILGLTSILKGKPSKSKYHCFIVKGRLEGFIHSMQNKYC